MARKAQFGGRSNNIRCLVSRARFQIAGALRVGSRCGKAAAAADAVGSAGKRQEMKSYVGHSALGSSRRALALGFRLVGRTGGRGSCFGWNTCMGSRTASAAAVPPATQPGSATEARQRPRFAAGRYQAVALASCCLAACASHFAPGFIHPCVQSPHTMETEELGICGPAVGGGPALPPLRVSWKEMMVLPIHRKLRQGRGGIAASLEQAVSYSHGDSSSKVSKHVRRKPARQSPMGAARALTRRPRRRRAVGTTDSGRQQQRAKRWQDDKQQICMLQACTHQQAHNNERSQGDPGKCNRGLHLAGVEAVGQHRRRAGRGGQPEDEPDHVQDQRNHAASLRSGLWSETGCCWVQRSGGHAVTGAGGRCSGGRPTGPAYKVRKASKPPTRHSLKLEAKRVDRHALTARTPATYATMKKKASTKPVMPVNICTQREESQ